MANFSVGLDREIMVHREIGRGKEEKRMRGGPYQKKKRRNNFLSKGNNFVSPLKTRSRGLKILGYAIFCAAMKEIGARLIF